MEKGRRGLAGAEAGSSGEAVGPGEKQEAGFTKPEVLEARKASQRARLPGNPSSKARP